MEKDGIVMKGCHVDENGHIVCDTCGTTKLKRGLHIDGGLSYTNQYICKNGHTVSVTLPRAEDDLLRVCTEESIQKNYRI